MYLCIAEKKAGGKIFFANMVNFAISSMQKICFSLVIAGGENWQKFSSGENFCVYSIQ